MGWCGGLRICVLSKLKIYVASNRRSQTVGQTNNKLSQMLLGMPQVKKTGTHNRNQMYGWYARIITNCMIFMEFIEHSKFPFSTVHHFYTLWEIGNGSLLSFPKSLAKKHPIECKTNNHIEFEWNTLIAGETTNNPINCHITTTIDQKEYGKFN